MPYNASQNEEEVLKYWEANKIFEKSVESRPEGKPYHFYDGPPFATGLPHYGHIVASLMKDVVPRYWTMKGKRVERKWGWDCHGLPIENIIEKELNLNSKKDIENFGIGNFNEACRATVLKYAGEWKKTIRRMGRWVDMENDYKTMDVSYMESVWWVFKQLWDNDLIYKGHKAMHVCPRCVTPLSNFEVTQGYKDIKDVSVIAKFKITDQKFLQKYCGGRLTSFVAWTTTPWSIPTTMGLAVGADFDYVVVDIGGEQIICAKNRFEYVTQHLEKGTFQVVSELKGAQMEHISYTHPFDNYLTHKDVVGNTQAYKTHLTGYVSVEDGTGIVTINGAYGEIDYESAKKIGLPIVVNVRMDGTYDESMDELAGLPVKPIDDPTSMDVKILQALQAKGALLRKEKYTHSYPHCWRCDSPLLNYLTVSWFVKVTHLKEKLLSNNKEINWVPEHIKEGRFGQWLEGARDWAVSRNRYWGTPLPVWESEDGESLCVGSVEELEKLIGQKVTDLHKHKIDHLEIKKDGKVYKRIPEVLDCWFESGSMPYGQMHYPFENKKKFESSFPAEFIAEGQDQTRGWFYTLHVLATALTLGPSPAIPVKKTEPAFRNCIVNGIVLAEDGKKMSKRLKNYPEPEIILEKYGADAMRYYFVTSPVMEAEALNFSEVGVREMYNKVVNTLWNVFTFYEMFVGDYKATMKVKPKTFLDLWIYGRLQELVDEVTKNMDDYKLIGASRPIVDFITDLSQWYLRRSRDRMKNENVKDKEAALETLHGVLCILSEVMAPFTPFIAEKIYQELGKSANYDREESVHLEDWPKVGIKVNPKIMEQMKIARKIVEMGLSLRAETGIKVRQPLSKFLISNFQFPISDELLEIIADELNVKKVEIVENIVDEVVKEDGEIKVSLDIIITDDLKKEGLVREIVRTINQMRKEQKLTISDLIKVEYTADDILLKSVFADYTEEIKKSVLASDLSEGAEGVEVEIDGKKVKINIVK